MLQGITRRAKKRNLTRSPARKPIRSSSSKGRSPNGGIFGSSSSPTSRNQRRLQRNDCVWILWMLTIGFLFYLIVLKWHMIHTEREESTRYHSDDGSGRSSQGMAGGPYAHGDLPSAINVEQLPSKDVKPRGETTTLATKANIRHPGSIKRQDIHSDQKQLRETQSRIGDDSEKQQVLSHKTKMSQPRHLTLSMSGEEPIYYQVSTAIQQLLRRDSQREPIEMILPIPNITETSPPEPDPIPEQEDNANTTPKTLTPLQERREQCIPQESWQTDYLINCNGLHELDMVSASFENTLNFLGQGWFRAAWKFSFHQYSYEEKDKGTKSVSISQEGLVLKTLRMEREFLDEYYELHRRDAVAMERLTWSEYVMDVYGYCGQSALNELAYFKDEINNLEQLDRAMRSVKQKEKADREKVEYMKLKLATSVATGISHVHQVHSPSSIASGKEPLPSKALMAHYDINPRNIAIVKGGKPKLNDFNIAEFIQYNPNTNQSCGFPSRLHEPWWRAPEEMYLPEDVEVDMRLVTEKVDVYALGAVLFHILTTHSPRGKMKQERMAEVREVVARGVAPFLPAPYNVSDSPAVKAIREAMELCFVVDPVQRGSSHQVAKILQDAVKMYEEGGNAGEDEDAQEE